MDQESVSDLDRLVEKAVSAVILGMGLARLPLLPSQRTMHLLAKAAVSVYEAAVESQGERP